MNSGSSISSSSSSQQLSSGLPVPLVQLRVRAGDGGCNDSNGRYAASAGDAGTNDGIGFSVFATKLGDGVANELDVCGFDLDRALTFAVSDGLNKGVGFLVSLDMLPVLAFRLLLGRATRGC